MGVESETTGRASRNSIGACTSGPASRVNLAVHVFRGGICLFDGRVVRDCNGLQPYTLATLLVFLISTLIELSS